MTETSFYHYFTLLNDAKMPAGKRKLILASLDLFSRQGYHGTSTAQIANQAGVSQATLFKYFKTKEKLLLEMLEPVIPALFTDFFIVIKDISELEELIPVLVQDRIAFIERNQSILTILFQEVQVNAELKKTILTSIRKQEIDMVLMQWHQKLLKANPQMDAEVPFPIFVRRLTGPIMTYVVQVLFLGSPSGKREDEIAQIIKQIKVGLLKN